VRWFPAELIVWAAGIKAPDFLRDLDGLEAERINSLVVRPTLQTTRRLRRLLLAGVGQAVAPRAQTDFVVKAVDTQLRGTPLQDFCYRDFGLLTSLGDERALGVLLVA
jgi:NADH:ubiquinone reductase (H+-translocating)